MLSVDRIENNYAVCVNDDGEYLDIELSLINGEIKEGDILTFDNGKYIIDKEKTKSEREKIQALQDDLFIWIWDKGECINNGKRFICKNWTAGIQNVKRP